MTSFNSFVVICFMHLVFPNTGSIQVQPIVSVKTIPDGGVFNITCDASRLTIPPEDSSVTSLFLMFIDVLDSNSQVKSTVAQYYPISSNPAQRERKYIPSGRNWVIEFSGGNNGSNNRNTMRINILVRDARCTDAGLYTCRTQYLSAASLLHEEFKIQNVTAEVAVKDSVLTLVPLNNGLNDGQNYSIYELNQNITMSCKVDGPANLVIKWKREVRPAVPPGITYEDYPFQNDISVTDPTMTGSSTCQLYTHKSDLTFSVSERDKKRIYLCVAQVDNVDVITTGATIDLLEVSSQVQPIVSVKTIPDGGVFNITCDASHVKFPSEDSGVTNLMFLMIDVLDSTSQTNRRVAQYYPGSPIPADRVLKNIPSGRNWVIEFSGGNNGINNRNTMRIDILVRDARCTDAGIYTCTTQYISTSIKLSTVSKTQNVEAEAGTTLPIVIMRPLNAPYGVTSYSTYYLNQTVSLTCRYEGPQHLAIKWRQEKRPSFIGEILYEDYPNQNDITEVTPSLIGSVSCPKYSYSSVLQFRVSNYDQHRSYLCVVQSNGVDVASSRVIIGLNECTCQD